MNFPKEDEFDCFKLNHMTSGEVLKFDKNNFVGFADFNGRRIYRKIQINDGVVNIQDFSKDVELEEYNSCLLYTSPSPRDPKTTRMPSSA